MPESELDRDGQKAAAMGTSSATPVPDDPALAPSATPMRTPRWVWLWVLPLLLLLFLYMARTILGPFIIAGVLAYIFSMVIDRIQERVGWPRFVVVALTYLGVLGVAGVGLYFGAESIYQQTRQFITGGPNIVERALQQFMGNSSYTFGGTTVDAHYIADRLNEGIKGYFGGGGDAVHLAGLVVGRLLDTLLVLIVTFYLLLSGKQLGSYLLKFVPADARGRTGYVAGRIHTTLGAYLRGQLLLIALMSVVSFIVLQFIFNVPYAVPLGILTGFLEILPLLGPAIAAIIAAGVALSAHGAGAALGVVVAYFILRQLEDQLVMPLVVGRAVELHPVVTIFAVLAGGAMAGVLGMLLAVPVAAAIKVILDFLYPTDPEKALAQARPGMKKAKREAEERDESPAPAVATQPEGRSAGGAAP